MTYWLVIFQIPVPVPNMGAMKNKITRAKYEGICTIDDVVVEIGGQNYQLTNKKLFSLESDQCAFIVCDAKKLLK